MTEEATVRGTRRGPAANGRAESAGAAPTGAELLQRLGASVLPCWSEQPFQARVKILAQVSDVVGTRPIADARKRDHQIIRFLLRHTKI